MPKKSYSYAAIVAACALANALSHPTPAAPFAKLGSSQLRAIEDLASIFDQAIVRPPPAHFWHRIFSRLPRCHIRG